MDCKHENTYTFDNIELCEDCCEQLYVIEDNTYLIPNMSYHSRTSDRIVIDFCTSKGVSEDIAIKIDQKYMAFLNNYKRVLRSDNRAAIIMACAYFTYIEENIPMVLPELIKKFGINKGRLSGATKTYEAHCDNLTTKINKPQYLVEYYIVRLNIKEYLKDGYYDEVVADIKSLTKFVYKNCPTINNSYPISIACTICYYYVTEILVLTDMLIDKSVYDKKNLTVLAYSEASSISKATIETILNKLGNFIDLTV